MPDANDLGAILGVPGLSPKQVSPAPPALPDTSDADLIARTAVAEGDATPDSWAAVAGVIRNRMAKTGKTAAQVISEPNQFEAYGNGNIQGVDPGSPRYQAALAATQGVKAGDVPYDAFYSPSIVAARGHGTPPFDPATGVKVGTQLFGNGYGAPPADLAALLGLSADQIKAREAMAPEGATTPEGRVRPPGGPILIDGQVATLAQQKFYSDPKRFPQGIDASVGMDGTAGRPYAIYPGRPLPQTPMAHYVDLDGKEHVVPGGVMGYANSLMHGAAQSLGPDTFASAYKLTGGGLAFPASEDGIPISALSDVESPGFAQSLRDAGTSAINQQQRDYSLAHAGDSAAALGRTGGDVAKGVGASLLAPEIKLPGAAAKTLGGATLRFIGNRLTNAGQGVAAQLPNVGVSNEPVPNQLVTAATLGGVAGPAADVLGGATRAAGRILAPMTEGGRNRLADELFVQRGAGGNTTNPDLTEYIPGSTPTTAQAYGNPGWATAERGLNAANSTPVSDLFARNAKARAGVVAALQGDDARLAALEAQRDAVSTPLRDAAFANVAPVDSTPVVNQIDAALATPGGQESAARAALTKARSALTGTEKGLPPEQQAAFEGAAAQSMGVNAPAITRAVMATAKKNIGQTLNDVAARTNITDTDGLLGGLGEIINHAQQVLPDTDVAPLLKQVQNIASTINGGQISGDSYQALTRNGTPLDVLTGSANPNVSRYARQIEGQLQASLQAAATPEDAAALLKARNQWRNMRLIESAHGNSLPGEPLDPDKLYGQIAKQSDGFAYRGGGDLGDVAERYALAAQPRAVTQSSPVLLHGVQSDLAAAVNKGGDVATQLAPVRDTLIDTIDRSAPGYRDYLAAHDALSQPIQEHQFLRNLNLSLPGSGNVTADRIGSALRTIEQLQRAPGANGAKALSDDTMATLQNLRADLAREGNSQLGRGTGSDTVQKAIENATTGGMAFHPLADVASSAVGALHPAAGFALNTANALLRHGSAANRARILEAYAGRLLDPALAETALNNVGLPAVSPGNRLLGAVGRVPVPLLLAGRNYLVSPPPSSASLVPAAP